MRALVLGATGHIGNALVRELLAHGYEVTAASRSTGFRPNIDGLAVRRVCGDTSAAGMLDRWVRNHDLVVDAAAPYPLHMFWSQPGTRQHLLATAEQRTRALLHAVWRHGARLAYVSTFTTVARDPTPAAPRRGRLLRALHPYFAVKEFLETLVLAEARRGLPAVIVNPTMCLGPWDAKPRVLCFVPQLLCGQIPVPTEDVVNVIDVRDVALGLVAAVHASRLGEPILLSGYNLSMGALTTWLCEAAGVQPPRARITSAAALAAVSLAEACLALAGHETAISTVGLALLRNDDWLVQSAAQRELGLVPRPLSRTLLDTIQWYRTLGYC